MAQKTSKAELLDNLRGLLRDVFKLRTDGAPYPKLARAHGYVDGYMRVLMETGVSTQKELLGVVADERRRWDGPATVTLDPAEIGAA